MKLEVPLDLFDKTVKPILLYGAELWGYGNRPTPARADKPCVACKQSLLRYKLSQLFYQYTIGTMLQKGGCTEVNCFIMHFYTL